MLSGVVGTHEELTLTLDNPISLPFLKFLELIGKVYIYKTKEVQSTNCECAFFILPLSGSLQSI